MDGIVHNSDVSETSSAPETLDELLQESVKHDKPSSVTPVAHIFELQDYFNSALVVSEKAASCRNEGTKMKKIEDGKPYQSKKLISTHMEADSSKNGCQISKTGFSNRRVMKFSKFKKKFSKVLVHKVTYSGVTIKITEYLPGKGLRNSSAKTQENSKLQSIFRRLCTHTKGSKDAVDLTLIDIASASYRRSLDISIAASIESVIAKVRGGGGLQSSEEDDDSNSSNESAASNSSDNNASYGTDSLSSLESNSTNSKSSITFFEEQNSVGPLRLKSHIQDFREGTLNIWNSKKDNINQNYQFIYDHQPQIITLKYPLPKFDHVFPSSILNFSEIMDIEKKINESLSIRTISENKEFDELQNRNNFFNIKSSNNELEPSVLEFYSNINIKKEFLKKGCSDLRISNSVYNRSILDIAQDSQQFLNIKEKRSEKVCKNQINDYNELLNYYSHKKIFSMLNSGDPFLEKNYQDIESEFCINENNNNINKNVIPIELSDFVLEFDEEKNYQETKFNEEMNTKNNEQVSLDDRDKDLIFCKENDNVDKCDKLLSSGRYHNEYSPNNNSNNSIGDEYESPMKVSEIVYWDLDIGENNLNSKLNENEYSSDIEWINNVSSYTDSSQSLGEVDKHLDLASNSINEIDNYKVLQNNNDISATFNNEGQTLDNIKSATNNEYKSKTQMELPYHCFLMEAKNQVTTGVYDPVTETWRAEKLKYDLFDENCKQGNFKTKSNKVQNKRLSKCYYGNRNLAKDMCNLMKRMINDIGNASKTNTAEIEQARLELTLELLGLISASQFVKSHLEKRFLANTQEKKI